MNKLFYCVVLALCLNTSAQANSFWRTHTFIMIYASTCPHCHHQAEVLAPFLTSENMAYRLYSIDNKPIPPFEQFSLAPEGLLQTAYPDLTLSYPALFIVANQSLKLYPLSYGFLDTAELKNRLDALVLKIIQHEEGTHAS